MVHCTTLFTITRIIALTYKKSKTKNNSLYCTALQPTALHCLQIVRKTELRKEYELVKAEMEVIAGIIQQLPPTCPIQLPNLEWGK